jgi:hypothetical protein
MADFAEEFYRARWIRGATGPGVGNWFSGANRNGRRRWWTQSQITDAEPGRRFAYHVRTPFFVPISRWEYEIAPEAAGRPGQVRPVAARASASVFQPVPARTQPSWPASRLAGSLILTCQLPGVVSRASAVRPPQVPR